MDSEPEDIKEIDEILPEKALVSNTWKKVLINYSEKEYPPRAWMWAWACIEPHGISISRELRRGLRASEVIRYLHKHKSEYLKFLFENKLPFDAHDQGYGFSFYTGMDEKRCAEEAVWKKFFYPPRRTKW